jgi:hypothetical protein
VAKKISGFRVIGPYRSGAAEGQSCMFGSSVTGSLDPQ